MLFRSRASVENRSRPVDCPDFTRGAWKTANGFTIDGIDLRKLPGDFSGAKRDEEVDKTARSEGLKS